MAYQKKGYKGKPKGQKKELTVKWLVANKKIVKFIEEESKTYKLADNVIEYLDEIKANIPVNVTIVDDKVIFIQKREGEFVNKEEEVEKESEQEANDEPQEKTADEMVYTVKAISKTRDYYLFNEAGEKEWFTIAPNVKSYLKDVKKGDVLKVNVEVTNDGKRDTRTITYAQVQSSSKEESKQETKKETSGKSDTNSSIEKQVALKEAGAIVRAYIDSKAEIVNNESKTSELLKRLTKVCYEAIQSL